jgi:hypothetical protein
MKRTLKILLLLAVIGPLIPAPAPAATSTVVTTLGASNIQAYSAVLWGSVVWTSNVGTSACYFAYGYSDGGTNLGSWLASEYSRTRYTTGQFWSALTGLLPESNYYFRAFVTNNEGQVWATNAGTFAALSASPTGTVTWTQQTVMAGSDGKLVSPSNFFTANGIMPTSNYELLQAQITANDGDIAALQAGQVVTTKQVIAADRTAIGSCLTLNPDMTNDSRWTAGDAVWNATGDGCYLINAGNDGRLTPSNALAISGGMTLRIDYSNALPSTGSVEIVVGGTTNSRAIATNVVSLLAHLADSSNLVMTIHATNGQTSIDGIRVYQVASGEGDFAGDVRAGGWGRFTAGVSTPGNISGSNLYGKSELYTRAELTTGFVRRTGTRNFEVGQGNRNCYSNRVGAILGNLCTLSNDTDCADDCSAAFSLALGAYAVVTNANAFVWGSINTEPNGSMGDDSFAVYAWGGAHLFCSVDLHGNSITNGRLAGDGAGVTNGSWWRKSEYAPTSSMAAGSNFTVSVSAGYVYFCFTNGWAGTGTNWMRAQLSGF